jgi:molecular chaperone GrpE (heat shock protein)
MKQDDSIKECQAEEAETPSKIREEELQDYSKTDTESAKAALVTIASINEISTQSYALLGDITSQIGLTLSILEDVSTKIEEKEASVSRVYAELDSYKRDANFQALRPLYVDLILFYDRLTQGKIAGEKSSKNLLSLEEELLEIFLRRDITRINEQDKNFNPKLQVAVDTKLVLYKEMHGKVVQIVRDGFISNNRILRPQEVILGIFTNTKDDIEPSDK